VKYFLIISLLLLNSTNAFCKGQDYPYTITSTSGVVLLWYPWASRWRQMTTPVAAPKDAILQVTNGATATVKLNKSTDSYGQKRVNVSMKVKSPMVVRLSHDLMRKMTFQRHELNKLPDSLIAENAPTDLAEIPFQLKEAWDKMLAVFTGKVGKSSQAAKDIEQMKEQDGIDLSVKVKKIIVNLPIQKQIINATTLPISVYVSWEHADFPTDYKVKIWDTGATKKNLSIITSSSFYNQRIYTAGEYQIQVSSRDDTVVSDPVTIFVKVAPKQLEVENEGNLNLDNTLTSTSPPDEFNIVTQSKKSKISFSWNDTLSGTRKSLYKLSISKLDSSYKASKSLSSNGVTIALEPGDYQWHVQADQSATDIRFLTVVSDDSPKKTSIALFKSLLSEHVDGIVYLDK
jgi:hypothetical protein